MNNKKDISSIKQHLTEAQDIVVIFGDKANSDVVAASLALYLSLEIAGKKVMIASPKKITVELTNLIGVNKISNVLGNKNFVISLDYSEDNIEKVSYHVDDGKFNLVIEPRESAPQLASDKVSYSYSGFNADALFVVGTQSIEQLGDFYDSNKAVFADKPIIVIDTKLANRRFGQVNIVQNMASVSELVYKILKELQLPINADIATNLYSAVAEVSNNFSGPQVTPDTFELIAELLRKGAKRSWGQRNEKKMGNVSSFYKKSRQQRLQQPQRFPQSQPLQRQQPLQQQEERPQQETQAQGPELKEGAPPDWLKPKIYKGSTKV